MLEDDTVVATKRIVAAMSKPRHYDGNRWKKGRDNQDRKGRQKHKDPGQVDHHNTPKRTGERANKNPKQDSNPEQARFTLSPSHLLLIVQSLQEFKWPRP